MGALVRSMYDLCTCACVCVCVCVCMCLKCITCVCCIARVVSTKRVGECSCSKKNAHCYCIVKTKIANGVSSQIKCERNERSSPKLLCKNESAWSACINAYIYTRWAGSTFGITQYPLCCNCRTSLCGILTLACSLLNIVVRGENVSRWPRCV